jgi:hypothetical protein
MVAPVADSHKSNNSNNAVRSLRILKQTKIVPIPTASPDEACCICLQLYSPSHKAVTVLIKSCYHRFGKECLNRFLDSDSPTNNTCPQCRCVWYIRQSAWSPRDTNTTEALAPFSIPRAPARVDSRAATNRTQYDLEHYQNTNNSAISTHFDEVFRRLDLIQDISGERLISTADTRVRLQAIERRARRINQDLQSPQEIPNASGQSDASLRGHEIRRRLQSTQEDNIARRRWMEAFAVELDDDPYSLMGGANRSRTSLPRTVSLPEEPQVVTETSLNGSLGVHPALRSSPPGLSPEPELTSQHQLRRSNNAISFSGLRLEPPTLLRTASIFPSDLASTSCGSSAHGNVTTTTADVNSASAPSRSPTTSALSSTTSDTTIDWSSDIHNPNFVGPAPTSLEMIIHPSLRPQESHSDSEASPQLNVSDRTPQEDMRRRALDTLQTTLANRTAAGGPPDPTFDDFQESSTTQPAASVPPTPVLTPTLILSTREPQRHPNLGNLRDPPTLRAPPPNSGRPSLSGRPRRTASTRETGQSKGKPRWLRKFSRVSSLSSLREVVLPGHRHVQDARAPQWPAAGRSSVANEVFRSNYWADPVSRH